MGLTAVGHLVIVGGKQRNGVDLIEIFCHRLDYDGALVGIGAPGELVQQKQGVSLLHLRQCLLKLHDLRAEAGKARLDGLHILKEHQHALKQRHPGCLGTHQESRLHQQYIQGYRLHGHALAAHVRTGDDRGAPVQGNGHRHKAAALLGQQIAQLGIDHVRQFQRPVGDLRHHTAIAHGKQCLLEDEVQPSDTLGVL